MAMKIKENIFGYITNEFDLFILDISLNVNEIPVKVGTFASAP